MTMQPATTTVTFTLEGVFVSASGRVKIAPTHKTEKSRNPLWRMWIYHEATDTWELQQPIFKRRDEAEAAVALVERMTA